MILLFIIIFLLFLFNNYRTKWDPVRPDFYPWGEIIKIGHRGAPVLAQENTVDSFAKAFKTDIKGIELDIQLSKDGELMVFHDWNLENLTGYPDDIEKMNCSEIQTLSLANNSKIPLLSEVLDICPKGKFINIEIKSQHYSNIKFVKKVINMIQTYKIEKYVVISSFNPFVLRLVKKSAPNFQTAYLWSSENSYCLFNSPLWIWICRPDGFHIDINNADKNNIGWARKNNLNVLTFTVNSAADLYKAHELGVDGIFTDDPYLKLSSTSL